MVDVTREVARDAAGTLHGCDAGQAGGAEADEFPRRFRTVADSRAIRLGSRDRADELMQAADDTIDVLVGQLHRVADCRLRLREHRNAMLVPWLGALGRQPQVDDLLRKPGADETCAESQYIGVVVFTAVSRARQIVGEGRPHAGHLVGHHARADPGAVDHDADVGPAG